MKGEGAFCPDWTLVGPASSFLESTRSPAPSYMVHCQALAPHVFVETYYVQGLLALGANSSRFLE